MSTGGVESGGFWEGKTRTASQALLHAAALDNCSHASCSAGPVSLGRRDAVAILSSSPALACLADPRVLDAVSPKPGEHFDPVDFLTKDGTLYLLATGAGSGASWSLVAAFIWARVERPASTDRLRGLTPVLGRHLAR